VDNADGKIEFMKIKLELNNKEKAPVKKPYLQKISKITLAKCGIEFLAEKNISFSVAFVSEKEIKKINRIYRKKNVSTDVLSFSEYGKKEEMEKEAELFLGEIVMCYNYIKKYAREKNMDTKNEVANVFSHGILHLLGFRHGQKMFFIQKEVVNSIK